MSPLDEVRAGLVARLRARRVEMSDIILTHLTALGAGSVDGVDASRVEPLRNSIDAIVDYALASIEGGGAWSDAVPLTVITQAREAAIIGMTPAAALRCYVAGHESLVTLVLDEISRCEIDDRRRAALSLHASNALASLLGRVLTAAVETYVHERVSRTRSREEYRTALVRRVLAGEQRDSCELDYRLDADHIAAIGIGPSAARAVRGLASRIGSGERLQVRHGDGSIWVWFNANREVAPSDLDWLGDGDELGEFKLAVGTLAGGAAGFRTTHRQAEAAMRVGRRTPRRLVRFADVALEALALAEESMAMSLVEIYLAPLETWRGGKPNAARDARRLPRDGMQRICRSLRAAGESPHGAQSPNRDRATTRRAAAYAPRGARACVAAGRSARFLSKSRT